MANEQIKEFVKKQTSTLTIGVPKQKQQFESPAMREERESIPVAPTVTETPAPVKGKIGRPKSEIEKVKISVYVPEEAKQKLIRIQHNNYKNSLNDLVVDAINDLIKKYDI